MDIPVMETERLLLRSFIPEDLDAVYQIFSDREVNRFLPWFPLRSREEAWEFYQQRLAAGQRKTVCYAVCLRTDKRPIGYVHLSLDDSHDFGYGFLKACWHRGIATEAGLAFVERLRASGLPYITATHDILNPRSGRVMQRLGMRYCYSYQERWMPKDIQVTFRMYQLNLDGDPQRVYRGYWDRYPVHGIETGLVTDNTSMRGDTACQTMERQIQICGGDKECSTQKK